MSEQTSTGANARALLLAQGSRMVVQTVGVAVLARLLTPADFGVVAISTAIMGIAGILGDLGLSIAAIREKTLSRRQWTGLFWLNAAFGLMLTALVAGASPLIASVLGEPGLARYIAAVAPVFVLNGCSVQYRVQLNRDGRFGSLGLIETIGPVLGLVSAVTWALLDPGPWPLIAQQVVGPAVVLVLAVALVRRWPGYPVRHAGVRTMAFRGGALSAAQVLVSISDNLGVLALGRFAPDAMVGSFSRASTLTKLPHSQLGSSLARVTIPALARAHGTDAFEGRLSKARATYGYSVGIFTALVGGLAEPLVAILLGSQWLDVTPTVVAVLSLGIVSWGFGYVFYWALAAAGEASLYLRVTAPRCIVIIAGILLAAPYGPVAVSWAYAVGMFVGLLIYCVFALPVLGVSRRQYLGSAGPNIALLLLVFGGASVIVRLGHGLGNIALVVLGAVWTALVCGVLAAVVPAVRADLTSAVAMAKSIVGLNR